MTEERSRQLRHGGARGPRGHHHLGHVQRQVSLDEEGLRPPAHRFGGVGMTVFDRTGEAAEQGPGLHASAVECEGGDLGGGVPKYLDDLDLLEQAVHTHDGGPPGAVTPFR